MKYWSQVEAQDEFIKINGIHFMLNGSSYYANGFNAYWLMHVAWGPKGSWHPGKIFKHKETAFQRASNHGLTVARTWGFSDGGYRALRYSPSSFNEQTLQGLDFVVSEAKRYGIKLILSLVNNYENFGGKKQYVDWARSQGQNLASDDDFFTNSVVKGYYKNHIKTVLTRRNSITGVEYKDDPTIMAWEQMALYLKSIDSNHLLEAGLEGFYGQTASQKQQFNPNFQVGTDFIANNQILSIDFATIHSYPDVWLPRTSNDSQISFLNNWVNTHIQNAQNILGKPLLVGEFGKSWKDPSFDTQQRDILFKTVYSAIYSSASGGGAAAGGMFWQLLTEGTASLIARQSQKLKKIRKMYVRLRNVEIWRKARDMNKRGNTGN
ncbi:hypothetical protein ACSBR2_000327 [Camellia fascicularis]